MPKQDGKPTNGETPKVTETQPPAPRAGQQTDSMFPLSKQLNKELAEWDELNKRQINEWMQQLEESKQNRQLSPLQSFIIDGHLPPMWHNPLGMDPVVHSRLMKKQQQERFQLQKQQFVKRITLEQQLKSLRRTEPKIPGIRVQPSPELIPLRLYHLTLKQQLCAEHLDQCLQLLQEQPISDERTDIQWKQLFERQRLEDWQLFERLILQERCVRSVRSCELLWEFDREWQQLEIRQQNEWNLLTVVPQPISPLSHLSWEHLTQRHQFEKQQLLDRHLGEKQLEERRQLEYKQLLERQSLEQKHLEQQYPYIVRPALQPQQQPHPLQLQPNSPAPPILGPK